MCICPRWGEANRLSLGASYLGRVPASGVAAREESSLAPVLQATPGQSRRGYPRAAWAAPMVKISPAGTSGP